MVDYLIIARSGRALAASAKRAGYKVSVADCFADEDTKTLSESVFQLQYDCDGFAPEPLIKQVQEVISNKPNAGIVIGTGFESNPDLLDKLAEITPVLGNRKKTIKALKDPKSFFEILERHSIPYPEISLSRPTDARKYLIKKIAGVGGEHVNWSERVNPEDESDFYFQEFTSGNTYSVVFIANGTDANIVGFNQQLQSQKFADMPFLYLGAIRRDINTVVERDNIENIINKITRETNLKGLCGLDYIINEEGEVIVLEVNPRPPASFELHETKQSLFEAHLSCFSGKKKEFNSQKKDEDIKGLQGYAILYAKEEMRINDKINWPLWVKERPSSGNVVPARFPVCTVHAEEISLDKVKTMLFNRLQQIESMIVAMQNAA